MGLNHGSARTDLDFESFGGWNHKDQPGVWGQPGARASIQPGSVEAHVEPRIVGNVLVLRVTGTGLELGALRVNLGPRYTGEVLKLGCVEVSPPLGSNETDLCRGSSGTSLDIGSAGA